MRLPAATLAAMTLAFPVEAQDRKEIQRFAPPIVHETTPALGDFTDRVLFGQVWSRTEQLSARDRSLVTVSALVAAGQTAQLTGHLNRGLDNGLTPEQVSGLITHLAFYAGWPRAMSAVPVAREVFDKREISTEGFTVESDVVELEAAAEAQRAASVDATVGPTAQALADFTNDVLFGELWRRGDLDPRDRSLVTVVSLIVNGQADQLPYHLQRGMDNGLTQQQLSEAITHLAFYAGWPRAMSAVAAVQAVASTAQTTASTEGSAAVEVMRPGDSEPTAGPATNFSGSVQVASRFSRDEPSRIGGGTVTFEAGARTAWHTHPVGQSLFVTAGCGLVQQEGGQAQLIRPGDVVWIPPQVKHWHGATTGSDMTHVAVAEAENGSAVEWMELVTDEQFSAANDQAC